MEWVMSDWEVLTDYPDPYCIRDSCGMCCERYCIPDERLRGAEAQHGSEMDRACFNLTPTSCRSKHLGRTVTFRFARTYVQDRALLYICTAISHADVLVYSCTYRSTPAPAQVFRHARIFNHAVHRPITLSTICHSCIPRTASIRSLSLKHRRHQKRHPHSCNPDAAVIATLSRCSTQPSRAQTTMYDQTSPVLGNTPRPRSTLQTPLAHCHQFDLPCPDPAPQKVPKPARPRASSNTIPDVGTVSNVPTPMSLPVRPFAPAKPK